MKNLSKILMLWALMGYQQNVAMAFDPNFQPPNQKLESMIIPNINFDKLDIDKALDYLTMVSKKFDPSHSGYIFLVRLPSDAGMPHLPIHRQVSITLENVPMRDVLCYISEQTNLAWKAEGYTVVFVPVSAK